MFQPNHQLPIRTKELSTQDPLKVEPLDRNDPCVIAEHEMKNGEFHMVESIIGISKKLQDDVQKLGLKIKHHEENLKFLKRHTNKLDESILDMQVNLGRYHSSSEAKPEKEDLNHSGTEETVEQILQLEKSAAGILCQLKIRHVTQASNLASTKDVLGIVATLAKVDNDNISRLFSEYLGLETMLAIVCKTFEGVKALEVYDKEGRINKCTGLHGLGPSIGRHMDGRFMVICLENLRPYAGEFVADEPQKKLALLKPRLQSGESPPGFLGFAVNMINLDSTNLSFLTAGGNGLRETLFYSLFSRLQVYRTRTEMLLARPCISDGALSLDGGMIRCTGVFSLGNRKDIEVRFPIGSSNLPTNYMETENQIKLTKWEKERTNDDIRREQTLLDHAKRKYESKKQEYVKFLADSSLYMSQNQVAKGQERSTTPR